MMLRRLLLLASLSSIAMPLLTADAPDIFDRVEHHEATSSDGVKIHYVSIGQGPVVLFVHGFPDFWYTWRHQMEALRIRIGRWPWICGLTTSAASPKGSRRTLGRSFSAT